MLPANFIILMALVACEWIVGCASVPQEESFAKVFGRGTVTVTSNTGGTVSTFVAAAEEVLSTGRRVRIDGRCDSACALFADLARPNVCITKKAVFGFHQMTRVITFTSGETMRGIPLTTRVRSVEIREPPHASPDIKAWVEKRGGFPMEGVLYMNAAEASAFWPTCK